MAAGAGLVLAGCGGDEAKGETPEAGVEGSSSPVAEAPRGAGAVDDENLIEPLVGERRLAKDAIVVDPYQLMPKDLPISEEARAEVAALVRSLQPLDPTLTSDHHDRWFAENKRLIEALEKDERADVGYAALHAFTNYPLRHFPIRRTLLAVGARVAPEEAQALLAELAFNYGHNIEDRSEAALLLAETSPEVFMEGARPYIERKGRPFETAPDDEFFVRGWAIACEKSGESPVPMMAQVATNLALQDYARVVAVRTLQKHADDPLAQGAIKTTLVESTGNAYLRRVSAQAVLSGFPRETACSLLSQVLEKEADVNFARFLDEMIQLNCR